MYVTAFTVMGAGNFPVDMLRRDACYPADDEAVAAICGHHSEPVSVNLKTLHPYKHSAGVTFERWESFSWVVIAITTRKIR